MAWGITAGGVFEIITCGILGTIVDLTVKFHFKKQQIPSARKKQI